MSSSENNSNRFREEVMRLLLSAGYFRVRMPDIDDFDKVAGGLAWALKSSSVDVDVDIFFKERPNIGEKIKISESICAGLAKSKCPFPLAPYQIQGLDFPKLFPIMQWLVKLVIATRNEFGDFMRSYAEFSFNNRYANLPSDVLIQEHSHASRSNIHEIERFFPPKRMYKRSNWDQKEELKSIETTLLEYGRIPTLVMTQSKPAPGAQASAAAPPRQTSSKFAAAAAAVGGKLGGGVAQATATKQPQEPSEEELKAINEQREREMRDTIKSMVKTDEIAIDGATFAMLVNNDEDIVAQKAILELQQMNAIPESRITESQLRGPHEQKMAALKEELDNFKQEGRKIKSQYDEVHAKYEEISSEFEQVNGKNISLKKQIAKCNKIIEESQHTDDLLRAITVRDDTQRNYDIFKEQCDNEIKEWTEKINAVKENSNNSQDDGGSMIAQTLEQLERAWENKQKLVAEKERQVLQLKTDFDQVPTNAELTQYDRRLNELNQLGDLKNTEKKKCQQLLDALIESQEVLSSENDLFNKILKQFNQAVGDSKASKALLEEMNVEQNKTSERKKKVSAELTQKKNLLSQKEEQHRKLLEMQRKYFQAIKDFQTACDELAALKGEDY